MIEAVVTGGQTGAAQAAWRAARHCGIRTGGWMPNDFATEGAGGRGSELHPEFAGLYGARAHDSRDYRDRRRANLRDSDAAIVFNKGARLSPGSAGLMGDRKHFDRPVLLIYIEDDWRLKPRDGDGIADWIGGVLRDVDCPVLMVAGNRESKAPGIGGFLEYELYAIFAAVAGGQR